jgi:DnaJ-class molecular chaperone
MGNLIHSLAQAVISLGEPRRACARCKTSGTVYHTRTRPGAEVLGGKRIPCPDCDGAGWIGGRQDGKHRPAGRLPRS